MPDKEQILDRIKTLPTIPMGHVAEDHEIWEGEEFGAHFKVTKEALPVPLPKPFANPLTVYALSISGLRMGKEKIISDFVRALGRPIIPADNLDYPPMTMVLWTARMINRPTV